MFGRVLRSGCFVVVGFIFLTGCLLSSSIEQHMAADYNAMAASVNANSQADNPNTAQQIAIIQGIIQADTQDAARYNILLLGVVVVVLGTSAIVVFTVTLYLLSRYLQPITKEYNDVLTTSRVMRANRQQSPFTNAAHDLHTDPDKTIPHNPFKAQFSNHSSAYQPHCERLTKRYKVDNK